MTTGNTNIYQDSTTDCRLATLDVSKAFAPMRGLLITAHRLAVNAELICAKTGTQAKALAIIATDLTRMITELGALLDQVRCQQLAIARHISVWIQQDERRRFYLRAGALSRDPMITAAATNAERATGNAIYDLTNATAGLETLLERTRWLGTKHSQYLAVLATIESRRFDSHEMRGVADDIRALASQLTQMEEQASDQIRGAILGLNKAQRSRRAR